MPEPKKRSNSKKKVKKKMPGGDTRTHYKPKKKGLAKCGRCKDILKGASTRPRKSGKSQRKPARPYAGILCSQCLDSLIRYKTRFEATTVEGFEDLDFQRDLTLEKFLPRGWYDNL